jgi:hypothetical protein
MKTLTAVAHALKQPAAIEILMSVDSDLERDGSPLLVNPSFTWADGYHGDSDIAFRDLVEFFEQSESIDELISNTDVEGPLHLACGVDLLLGMARCVFEAEVLEAAPDDGARTPYTYAGSAAFYCDQIPWSARRLDSSADLARAIGAPDLDEFRSIAVAWYPYLLRKTQRPSRTCASWEQATG